MSTATLNTLCKEFHTLLDRQEDVNQTTKAGQEIVHKYTSDNGWFIEYLKDIHEGRKLYNEQRASLWPNEITLYRSPDQSLIIFLYIWEPYTLDAVHDHGSWGIIGNLFGKVREVKYRRLDDGYTEGFAELEETSSLTMNPGQTTHVLAMDEGIHRMENVTDNVSITLNIYGKSIRKGFINFFNPGEKRVRRMYPPRTHKEVLIIRSLGYMKTAWARQILDSYRHNDIPDYIRRECELSLSGIPI
jgi:predicted metal-dependent enzyme (double-stranded beta helix superfamily)